MQSSLAAAVVFRPGYGLSGFSLHCGSRKHCSACQQDVCVIELLNCLFDPASFMPAALELLVSNSVTGMPVLDDDGCVVGVVSDYDLLSLEGIADKVCCIGQCI